MTCMRAGAYYYITKPFEPVELSAIVISAARHSSLRKQLAIAQRPANNPIEPILIGISPPMRKLRAALDRLAEQDVSLLVQGESGTGKELDASAMNARGACQ